MHYFGTDGIRAKADELLNKQIAYYLGKAISKRHAKIIVARDVRTHSLDIEKQLCKGLLDGNGQIWLCGVLPTPALAYTALEQKADYAVMITASHNPPEFNGLKVFGKHGKKLSEKEECALDKEIFALTKCESLTTQSCDIACADCLSEDEEQSELSIRISEQNHRIRIVDGAEFLYAKHIKSLFPRFDGMKVRLDCANGCFATLAPKVFEALGANVTVQNNERNGEKVNVNCGCTHIDALAQNIMPDEIGFAFDGDGDRVLAIVDGKLYDGDAMLLALCSLYRLKGKLKKRFVAGTILTNTKLQRELIYQNVALLRTKVGDKHVLDALYANNCILGGEKSGHIIMLDKSNTGDGLITALSLLEAKRTMGSLPKFNPYPMLEFNIPADNPEQELDEESFQQKIALVNERYSRQGRLIVRPSGTEPLIRITYECFSTKSKIIFADVQRIFLGQ